MIQSNFSSMIGSKSIRFSGSQFCFVVEALNNAAGKLSFSPKPVQQQGSMFPQTAGDFLHRFNLRAHRFRAPFVQKLPRPIGRFIRPEELKLLFQQIAPDRLQIILQQIRQLGLLFLGQVFRAFQQQPATLRQHRFITLLFQLFRLLSTHLVDRLAHVRHDVEAVQNMDRLSGLLGNHLQVRLPHVTADIIQPPGSFLAKPAKETQQGLDLPLLANPQQAPAACIDLIDQRQVLVAPLPLNLVNTNGFNTPTGLCVPDPR